MRITINPTLDMETLRWVSDDGSYEYFGPVVECKKGREIMKENALADQAEAKTTRAREGEQYGVANKLEGEEVASTTPGSLSPAATARLASDRDQIANTYNGMRQTAFRTMGQRGFGSAPSGFAATAENAADLGEAKADTGAYRTAQEETQREREHAMGTASSLTGQQGNIGTAAGNSSTNAAVALNKAGSTAGDILGAAAQAAPIVAAPFTGGASLIPSLAHAAGGGTVEGGEPTVVGEEGPELFVPSAPGTVIPNRRTFAHMGKISPPLIQQTWS